MCQRWQQWVRKVWWPAHPTQFIHGHGGSCKATSFHHMTLSKGECWKLQQSFISQVVFKLVIRKEGVKVIGSPSVGVFWFCLNKKKRIMYLKGLNVVSSRSVFSTTVCFQNCSCFQILVLENSNYPIKDEVINVGCGVAQNSVPLYSWKMCTPEARNSINWQIGKGP